MDRKIFKALYNFGVKSGAVKAAALVTRASQPVFMLVFLAGLISFFLYFGLKKTLLFALCSFICLVLNSLLRKVIGRERPFSAEGVKCYIEHKNDGSFPSNHAACSMVIAVSWAACSVGAAGVFVLMAVITGISRVFVGVHYPLDVLVGWLIGVLFGFLCCFVIFL